MVMLLVVALVLLVVVMRVAMVIMVVDSDGMLIVGVVVAMMSVMKMFRKNIYIYTCMWASPFQLFRDCLFSSSSIYKFGRVL